MRVAIICFGLHAGRETRQPWFAMLQIADELRSAGHDVMTATDDVGQPAQQVTWRGPLSRRMRASSELLHALAAFDPDLTLVGSGQLGILRFARFWLPGVVGVVVTSARHSFRDIVSLSPRDVLEARSTVVRLIVESALPVRLLRRAWQASLAAFPVYLSAETQRRLTPAFGPGTRIETTPRALPVPRTRRNKDRVIFVGPPLGLRGVYEAVNAFEEASRTREGLKLSLVLRVDSDTSPKQIARIRRHVERTGVAERVTVIVENMSPQDLSDAIGTAAHALLPFKVVAAEAPTLPSEIAALGIPVLVLPRPGIEVRSGPVVVCVDVGELAQHIAVCQGQCRTAHVERQVSRVADRVSEAMRARLILPARKLEHVFLLGNDGVGKTTVAEGLASGMRSRVRWSRHYNVVAKPLLALTRLTRHSTWDSVAEERRHRFESPTPLRAAYTLTRSIDLVIDAVRTNVAARAGSLIGDRSPIDGVIDIAVATGAPHRIMYGPLPRLLRIMSPKNSLWVVLSRDRTAVMADRPDATRSETFALRTRLYTAIAKRLELPVVEVKGDSHDTVASVLALIGSHEAREFQAQP